MEIIIKLHISKNQIFLSWFVKRIFEPFFEKFLGRSLSGSVNRQKHEIKS